MNSFCGLMYGSYWDRGRFKNNFYFYIICNITQEISSIAKGLIKY